MFSFREHLYSKMRIEHKRSAGGRAACAIPGHPVRTLRARIPGVSRLYPLRTVLGLPLVAQRRAERRGHRRDRTQLQAITRVVLRAAVAPPVPAALRVQRLHARTRLR